MKRIAILFSVLCLASCSLTDDYTLNTLHDVDINSLILTKGSDDFFQRDFSISLEDLDVYLRFYTPEGKEVVDVTPITLYDDKVQGFLVTFNDGWALLSADKRTNAVLAESEKGNFNLEDPNDPNEGRKVLIKSYLSEVKAIQDFSSEEEANRFLGKRAMVEMENNALFWDLMTNPNKVLTRPHTKVEPNYVYVLDDIQYDTITLEVVNHLTQTRWIQTYPYNQYYPYTDMYMTDQYPTGCVPLAGAQMLYFMNDNFGVPEYAPTHAAFGGFPPYHYWSQTGSSSTIWEDMNDQDGQAAAVFIADVANRAGVSFINNNGDYMTGSTLQSLESVFNYYGIDVDTYTYSPDSVEYYIMERGIPVIADASYTPSGPYSNHTFIIDAGLKGQRRATYYYQKLYDDGTYGLGYHVYVYENVYIWKIGINWGMGSGYDYDWYLSTGNWTVNGMSFNYNRNTLLGYSID